MWDTNCPDEGGLKICDFITEPSGKSSLVAQIYRTDGSAAKKIVK
jgi:hypothetical protein